MALTFGLSVDWTSWSINNPMETVVLQLLLDNEDQILHQGPNTEISLTLFKGEGKKVGIFIPK